MYRTKSDSGPKAAVSVREIAEQVGLTKTAVLYHFPSKIDIVAALVEPLLADTEALLESARPISDPRTRRWAVVEGLMDTWLRHARLLRMQMQDQALSDDATYARLRDIALTARELIAGPGADFTERVRDTGSAGWGDQGQGGDWGGYNRPSWTDPGDPWHNDWHCDRHGNWHDDERDQWGRHDDRCPAW
ncbi:TetR/AcrR family transcriptional regulator [Nocardia sp. NPDC059239]|uniref:TetR/AcrR family transcriptional regulator n=1 Tax=unclassified Nocardia TaxID=2637762 RepID=UPI00368D78EA